MCLAEQAFSSKIAIVKEFLTLSYSSSVFSNVKKKEMALKMICRRLCSTRIPVVYRGNLFSMQGCCIPVLKKTSTNHSFCFSSHIDLVAPLINVMFFWQVPWVSIALYFHTSHFNRIPYCQSCPIFLLNYPYRFLGAILHLT
jgi:hypothetical protein